MRAVISVGQARRQLRAATDRVLKAIEGLPESVTRGPSMLPGWLWRARQVHHGHDHRPVRIAVGETVEACRVLAQMRYVLRRRARRAGQSLQAYMRDQVVALAERSTKDEAIEQIESVLARLGRNGPSAASIMSDLAAERR